MGQTGITLGIEFELKRKKQTPATEREQQAAHQQMHVITSDTYAQQLMYFITDKTLEDLAALCQGYPP